jgi:alkylation response protein AidB-like acyl-CoA dehydrogenase
MSESTAATDLGTAEILGRIRELSATMSENGVRIDAEGSDVGPNMLLLGQAGANRLNVPTELGGLWQGGQWGGFADTIETMVEISAADSSTAQSWSSNALGARQLFLSDLPEQTKRQLADELINENRRLVSSNSEAGGRGPVTGRRVVGGVVINGTKTFNSNSGGGGGDILFLRFALLGADGTPESATMHFALVRLDDPGLEQAHDWDNMGQRGTDSQTITYHEVFVPDGWHYTPTAMDPYFFGAGMVTHAAISQGIGEGALRAAIDYLRTVNRASVPKFITAAADPLIHRQLGEMSSELAAARALLLNVASDIEAGNAAPDELGVRGFRAKVASTGVSLDVSGRIHDLTGARSTANKYRFDRFWRNARTWSTHDSIDAKKALIGEYELSGEFPNLTDYFSF